MTYRFNTLISLVAIVSILMLTSCDVLDTGEEGKIHELNLHVNTTKPVVKSSDGSNSIEITKVKLVAGDFGFLNPVTREDTTIIDTLRFEKKFPTIASFKPGEVGQKIHLGQIEPDGFSSVYFHLRPPQGKVSDSELGNNTSLLIEGNYNNKSFTYRANLDTARTYRISPRLHMTDQTATLDVDFLIATEVLFKRPNGGLLDPTTETAKNKITTRLVDAFNFDEGDRTLRDYQNMWDDEK